MSTFKKAAVLENECEARLIEAVLKDREIPHMLRSYHDSAYDGLFQAQKGWGHVAAPEEYKDEIKAILKEIRERRPPIPFDEEMSDQQIVEWFAENQPWPAEWHRDKPETPDGDT